MKTDLLVIGAGLAGLVAAIEARTHGADVLVLDKLPDPSGWNAVTQLPGGIGNDTFRSGGGGLARFAGDALVEHLLDGPGELESGRDPVDILIERHRERGWGEVDERLLRTYCTRVFEDCRWLRDELKLPYDASGRTVKELGIGLFRWLHRTAVARGVRFLFGGRARALILDAGGAVRGVRAGRDSGAPAAAGVDSATGAGGALDIEACGVILATGGFQGSREMMMRHAGRTLAEEVVMVGSPDNTGDGHRMALEAGARMRHLDVCHIRTTDIYFGQGPSRFLAHIYPMGIYFNRNFERFVDEGVADSDTIANAIAFQPGGTAGLVFDDRARSMYPEEFDRYPRREQLIRSADSLEALAEKMHLSAHGLRRLVNAFNAAIRDGKAAGPNLPKTLHAVPIDAPPFHGFHPVVPAMNHTLGGLVVSADGCQVLNVQGNPIPGLYAAGTLVNWAYGKPYRVDGGANGGVDGVTTYKGSYHAGASSGAGIALVTGRLAAQKALEAARRASARGEGQRHARVDRELPR
ncbi:MAG: FAD-dependent oxidoreductase [Burkholderiales bacterium]|nr:FAD-dependent oxidoreductase [Burkholderiales bacterium]